MTKHIYRDGQTTPPKNIYRVADDGKIIKVKKVWRAISTTEYVKVWDVDKDFIIQVRRNSDGEMTMCIVLTYFGDCETLTIDWGGRNYHGSS